MEKLYSIEQIAESWGVSTRTVQRFVADGKIHHYKIGNGVKFSEKQLAQFLEESEY